uniref:Uncharacterized protein n=1 Tax=Trichuris muris TaxID=70415 RepID=A0A5S6QNL4_TRIMR
MGKTQKVRCFCTAKRLLFVPPFLKEEPAEITQKEGNAIPVSIPKATVNAGCVNPMGTLEPGTVRLLIPSLANRQAFQRPDRL